MTDEAPTDYAPLMDAVHDGWKKAMGVHFVRVTADEVIAELDVGEQHLQPLGVVHGGVHAGLVESVASVGGSVGVMGDGKYCVGLENHTSFLHAVRQGKLRAVGKPVARGRQSQVWEVNVFDGKDRLVASGRVRLLVIDQGAPLAGQGAALHKG